MASSMASACPICDRPIAPAATSCATCGFPVALEADGIKARAEPVAPTEPGAPAAAPPPLVSPPDPQAAQCDQIARQIDRDLSSLIDLGGDPLAIASDLRQAALTEADGRVVEALGILRRAQSRLASQIDELVGTRTEDVEARIQRLRAAGLATTGSDELGAIRGELGRSSRAGAIERLKALDERLFRFEGEWNAIQELLRQIESLREALREFGEVPGEIEADVSRMRGLLAGPDVSPRAVEEASQIGARALMLLHEGLPPRVEEELNRHAVALQQWPDEHESSKPAKTLHAEAVRHLRRGQLADATGRLRELRTAIRELQEAEPEPVPEPVLSLPVEAPPAPPPIDEDAALDRLLAKARGLAARVRGLPPESEIAYEAAGEIRRATEFLRARKLDEADLTLSRLMQTLSTEATVGG